MIIHAWPELSRERELELPAAAYQCSARNEACSGKQDVVKGMLRSLGQQILYTSQSRVCRTRHVLPLCRFLNSLLHLRHNEELRTDGRNSYVQTASLSVVTRILQGSSRI